LSHVPSPMRDAPLRQCAVRDARLRFHHFQRDDRFPLRK